jgi:glycosyltransferase involved in cell wall biosynthesis
LALPYLRQICAADLGERDGVDALGLFKAIRAQPKTVLVIPWLKIGGAEFYAADLLDALLGGGGGPALVVVTQQTTADAAGWEKREEFARLASFQAATLLFWPDFSDPSEVMFGRFLNILGAERTIVINSRVGLDAIAMFGRALSQNARLYCAYFSLDLEGSAAVYGARFPRRTTPFALTLTDNEPMAAIMRRLHGSQPGPGVAALPPRLPAVADDVFYSRVAARRQRVRAVGTAPRWIWISRIERPKGTDVLRHLAALRPAHQFDLFGPPQDTLRRLGLVMPNVSYSGVLPGGADFARYDGFVFMSLFEGMPNVALEMCQQAIPMILADVGGLRDTFDEGVLFVRHQVDASETASRFAAALDQVASMDGAAAAAMVTAARERALLRHSPAAHARAVAGIFGLS